MRLPLDRGKKRSESGAFRQDGMARSPRLPPIDQESGRQAKHSVRMGWRGLRSLRDATRFMSRSETPYQID